MSLEYIMIDGIMYPKVSSSKIKIPNKNYGKYGNLRLKFLKEYNKKIYEFLLKSNNLEKYLLHIDSVAKEMIEEIIIQKKIGNDVDEKLKQKDFLTWTGMMNNIKHEAEEIVIKEIVNYKI